MNEHDTPLNFGDAVRRASEAVDDGRNEDAARFWSHARRFEPGSPSLLIHQVDALIRARDMADADAIATAAMMMHGSDPRFAQEWCHVAEKCCAWEESARRCRRLREMFPDHSCWHADSVTDVIGELSPMMKQKLDDCLKAALELP